MQGTIAVRASLNALLNAFLPRSESLRERERELTWCVPLGLFTRQISGTCPPARGHDAKKSERRESDTQLARLHRHASVLRGDKQALRATPGCAGIRLLLVPNQVAWVTPGGALGFSKDTLNVRGTPLFHDHFMHSPSLDTEPTRRA